MSNDLHSELKPLKACLLRLNAKFYFKSEELRAILVENDYDEIWKNFGPTYFLDDEGGLNKFFQYLNNILFSWINANPNSSSANKVEIYINSFLSRILIGYINWESEDKNLDSIVESIKNIGPISQSTIEEIKMAIVDSSKNKSKVISIDNVSSIEIKYAIITALEDDEMEQVLPMIVKEGEAGNTRNLIEFGHLKSNPLKKIVYASQHVTGMVDAAILATEMLIRFNPQYLIMTGVLGGKPKDTNIGDVIVATKVIEIGKGKITDLGFKKETSVNNITSRELKRMHREKVKIQAFINSNDQTRNSQVNIHFGPIACVSQVIDADGFFEKEITTIDRKAIALEMESFAIVRACELTNDGRTMPIIIKSVMDNTQIKTDNAKPYAAWTSAQFLDYILTNDII